MVGDEHYRHPWNLPDPLLEVLVVGRDDIAAVLGSHTIPVRSRLLFALELRGWQRDGAPPKGKIPRPTKAA